MFTPIYNKVLVKFKTKYIRNFTSIMKLAAIQNNTSIEMADMVNIKCEIVAIPKEIKDTWGVTGYSTKDIKPGDYAIVSHAVIFDFLSTAPEEDPVFKNEVFYKGESLFMADIQHIYAIIRDGQIRMQNGYVMLEQLEAPSLIVMPANVKKLINAYHGVVSYIGHSLRGETGIDIQRGDKVYFHPNKIRNYQIEGKPFGIIKQDHILGKSIPSYEDLVRLN